VKYWSGESGGDVDQVPAQCGTMSNGVTSSADGARGAQQVVRIAAQSTQALFAPKRLEGMWQVVRRSSPRTPFRRSRVCDE